ncbi:MAG: phospho-N-acetylmuramoyl-pentapeptide-transferase [Candidatus Peribacteraceae bacterium]|nr:phospho-N-acetylmuramoyl-pentapeptide-transferase [Candidatus Peribacteraceae bacterium]
MQDFIPVRPEIPLLAILFYALVAFILGIAATPAYVRFLHRHQMGKQLRTETVDGLAARVFNTFHAPKAGTPTMGGLLIWGAILLTVLLSRLLSYFGIVERSLLQRGQVYLPLFMLVSFGLLGALDDYLNICCVGKKRGMDWLPKLVSLLFLSGIGALWFFLKLNYDTIHIPFYGSLAVGPWYILIFLFIIVGTANAVNVTDGLDGLAGGLLAIAFSTFGILAYLKGLTVLAAFCGVTVGAIAAFLWHNVPPALFFMGDTGSLALGGTLGVIALMIDQVLVLPFIGFIFVIEMLSVIIQLTSKKFRHGKKVFRAAPLHHHLEALQWGESKVTMRLWIIGTFMAFLGIIIGMVG